MELAYTACAHIDFFQLFVFSLPLTLLISWDGGYSDIVSFVIVSWLSHLYMLQENKSSHQHF